jgi:hypothetical protein
MPTDTERLDWLSTQDGYALVSDDGGRWAVVTDGMQNVPDDEPADIQTMFFIEAAKWKPSVREAIDAAIGES